MSITSQKKAVETKVLASFSYEPVTLDKGYAGRTLRVDLSHNEIRIDPVTEKMKELWVGGKGFDLWLMFKEIQPLKDEISWKHPGNPICFGPGPLAGSVEFPGAGKTIVTSISPVTETIIDSNVGGYFGPYLKFAGFDALTVVGKASQEVMIYIDAPKRQVSILEANIEAKDSHLIAEEIPEIFADNELDKRNIAVVSAGQASEHSKMGILNFSFWDWRRSLPRLKQAGRGGIGTVFRNKNLRAIFTRNEQIMPSWTIEKSKVVDEFEEKVKSNEGCCKNTVDEINAIIEKWDTNPEYVIEMMQDVQERFRHVSPIAIDTIAAKTKRPKAELYHIATFYSSLTIDKKGETTIQVCMGTACHVKGAARILDTFERILDVKAGGTTNDKKYTLEAVACIGACSIAPVIKIGEKVYGNVMSKDCQKLLKKEEANKKEVTNG